MKISAQQKYTILAGLIIAIAAAVFLGFPAKIEPPEPSPTGENAEPTAGALRGEVTAIAGNTLDLTDENGIAHSGTITEETGYFFEPHNADAGKLYVPGDVKVGDRVELWAVNDPAAGTLTIVTITKLSGGTE